MNILTKFIRYNTWIYKKAFLIASYNVSSLETLSYRDFCLKR